MQNDSPTIMGRIEAGLRILNVGSPLGDEWDPRSLFQGRNLYHPREFMVVSERKTIFEGREVLACVSELSGGLEITHPILNWLSRNWSDERIPRWFHESVESGLRVVASDALIVYRDREDTHPEDTRPMVQVLRRGGIIDRRDLSGPIADCFAPTTGIWRDLHHYLLPSMVVEQRAEVVERAFEEERKRLEAIPIRVIPPPHPDSVNIGI